MPRLKICRLRTHKMRELKRYSLVVSGTLRRLKLHTQLVKLYRKKLYRHVAVEGLCVCPALYAVTVGKLLVDLKKCVKFIVVDMPVLKGTCVNHIVDSGEYLIPLAFVLGRWLAGMINIFNPEKVVIGGNLSMTGDYILKPIKTLVRRYSLNLVNEDTKIVLSQLGDQVGLIGACANARIRAFDNQ